MSAKRPYRIEYSPEAMDHLEDLTARRARLLVDTVPRQLSHQPTTATRNRKLLRANQFAPWELRIGDLRVYYEVVESKRLVLIKGVGIKDRQRVTIGGEEVEL